MSFLQPNPQQQQQQQPPRQNGLPPSATPISANFLPPSIKNAGSPLPSGGLSLQTPQRGPSFQQQPQQQLNGFAVSNASSRTASPAQNQSFNQYMPPMQQASQQNRSLGPHMPPPPVSASSIPSPLANVQAQNHNSITTSMRNVSLTNNNGQQQHQQHQQQPSIQNGNDQQRLLQQQNRPTPLMPNFGSKQNLAAQQQPPPQMQPQSQQSTGQIRQQQQPPLINGQQYQPNAKMPPPPSSQPLQNNNPMPSAFMPPPPQSFAKSSDGNMQKRPNYPMVTGMPPPMPQHQQATQHQNYEQNQMYGHQQQPFQAQGTQQQQPLQYQNQFANFGNSQPQQQQQPQSTGGVVQHGFGRLFGNETVDLMQYRHILPTTQVRPPPVELGHEFYESVNCLPEVFRCTLTKIPESSSLLQKSRLPLGILIHPYRDLNNLPVIQCSSIVRCRSCRTYINPFVTFVDSKKWRCNLCFRVNEIPDEFQYDPISKSFGDVTRRPEVKASTIEFIAPSEYMLRPPQPAIYLFLLDVSQIAQQSGYLDIVCATLSQQLEELPGDARTRIGFVAYNSAVHFFNIAESYNQPHQITVVDIDDPFLPCPDNLLINLSECKELIKDLLAQLPQRFAASYDSNSALGAALQIAYKLMQQSGGRVTVFQTCLPNIGPGALKARENPNDRSAKEVQHLGPATDFYKRLALDCSGQQIAVDLFLLNSQYSDLATLSGISKFSGGCMYHFPLLNQTKPMQCELLRRTFERYITRKIGFESVMRVRCTRGLAIHTFHGNFFVRSTDLLSLPNVNPDAGFAMQISYEESLTDTKTVCFQAALLYTSSKGERRIRVHTLCLPVASSLSEVMYSADSQAIIGLIAKMAVDRSLQSSISDARDAFINASVDVFSAFRIAQNLPSGSGGQGSLVAPKNLTLLPLYMLALLKHVAFRTGTSTRLDDRIQAMCDLKTLPLDQLIRNIYPDFYQLDELFAYGAATARESLDDSDENKYRPPLLQLSAEKLDSRSVFMLDIGPTILVLVGTNVPLPILQNVFGVSSINEIPDVCYDLPSTGKPENEALHTFIDAISVDKPYIGVIQIIRDTSPSRVLFTERLVDDRNESSLSYYEFLQHLRTQVK